MKRTETLRIRKQTGTESDSPAKGNDLHKFITIVAAITLVVIALGFYFIHMLFTTGKAPEKIDLKSVISDLTLHRPGIRLEPNQVGLYFTTDGKSLTPHIVELEDTLNVYERTRMIIENLLEGPTIGMYESPIPKEIDLRALYIKRDMAILDLSGPLLEHVKDGILPQMLCVYSIVNSVILNSADKIKSVRILVEGKRIASLNGGLDIERPLMENVALISP